MPGPPPNIYEQQSANKRNTVLVMVVFALLVAFLGLGFDLVYSNLEVFPVFTLIALGVGAGSAAFAYATGPRRVLLSAGAVSISPANPQYRQLTNVVEEMAIASGLPAPQLYLIPDPDPNAFATGRQPQDAAIAVTEGLLRQLNRDELQAVVAHEMGHIRNFDVRLMTVIAALVGSVMLLVELGMRSMQFGGGKKGSSRRSDGGAGIVLFVVWLAAMILAPFVARVLAMAVSRQREYLADASAAELTRNPGALASALERIAAATEPTRSIKKGTAHLCIADPIGRAINEQEGWFANLLATHPPMRKRIAILRAMAYQPLT